MKEIKCENCGSSSLKLYAGKYTCEHCGSIFAAGPGDGNHGTVPNQFATFDIENDVLIEYRGFDRIVEIPEGITCVAEGAFDHTLVRTIRCPLSLTRFEGSFEKARNLQTFEAPGLKTITSNLFSGNKTIKKVVLENVQKIPRGAFYECSELKEVIIPKATTIGKASFQGCSTLKEVNLPNATIIGESAFHSSGICNLNAPKVLEIKEYGFYNCSALKEINLPELETIGDCGFSSCDNLTHIVLPNVKTAEYNAFSCEKLVHIEAPLLETLGNSAFEACFNLKSVVLPSVQSIGECAFWECEELTEVVCENATLIANSQGYYDQFVACPKLETIKLKEMPPAKRIQMDPEGKQTRTSNQSKLSNAEGKMRFCGIMGLTPYTFICGIFALCFVGKAKEENGGSLSKKAKRYLVMGVVGFCVWLLAFIILFASIA